MNDKNVINLLDYIENKENIVSIKDNKKPQKEKLLIKRIYSFTIDIACIFTIHAALMASFVYFISEYYPSLSVYAKRDLITVPTLVQLGVFLSSYFAYFLISQITLSGQTLGQKIYGIRVVDEDGNIKDDLKTIFLRTSAYFMYYAGIGFFQLMYFVKNESFADIISNTSITTKDSIEPVLSDDEIVEIEIESLDVAA